MAKKGRNISEEDEKYLVISIRIVAHSWNSSRCHCGAQSEQWCAGGICRLSILVSADVSQPIQKIIGISYLISADTINHILVIGCTMSVDTNNVLGIRAVTHQRETLTHGEILVCAVRLPNFPALYAVASVYTVPSTPPPLVPPPSPSTPHHRCHHHHPWVTLPLASTLLAVSPSSSPTLSSSPSPTPSHHPRLLL
jgi:hypothetical protein